MAGKLNVAGVIFIVYFCAIAGARFPGAIRPLRVPEPNGLPDDGDLPEATPTPECVDTVTCSSDQFVARCVTCQPSFFYCKTPGATAIQMDCPPGQVFNPDPLYPKCILPDNCPYHPPWTEAPTTSVTTTAAATTGGATTGGATTGGATTAGASTGGATTGGATTGGASSGAATTGSATTVSSATGAADVSSTAVASTASGASGATTASGASGATTASGASGATTAAGGSTAATTAAGGSTAASTSAGGTTAAASTTTSTSAPTPTPECVDTFTCPNSGFFAQCVTCKPTYFYCTSAGGPGILKECPSGTLFNTDPLYPKCVLESNCPYHPNEPEDWVTFSKLLKFFV